MIRISQRRLLALVFSVSTASAASTPVILISVDTLRADHLSCYGKGAVKAPATPHIDSLAIGGTIFTEIHTPYPLTLPAHAALLTSTYPFSNGVEDNGVPLVPGAASVAEVLKKAGYRTAAFVGSFVLDRRFGLDRGFDVYDNPFDLHNKTAIGVGERKRPGAQVTEAAKRWVETNAGAPFFIFLHLYDLHAPYDLPKDPSVRHGETGYGAELAYVDRLIGDFLGAIERLGIFDRALIVFTSDHGEGLGEHGESSHGYFVYQSTLHVPLIVHWPKGAKGAGRARVNDTASLLDVAPTILETLGLGPPKTMLGKSLTAPTAGRPVYSESVYARNHFGCAGLRSMRMGAWKYIDAPKPELYDLAIDPGETRNVYAQQADKAGELKAQLVALRAQAPEYTAERRTAAPETMSALRSLGYVAGSTAGSRVRSTVDPKDRIEDFERYVRAIGAAGGGSALAGLAAKYPDVADVRMSLGMSLLGSGKTADAAREFERVAQSDPKDAPAHFELGTCLFRMGRAEEAVRQFEAALDAEPWYTRADEALADLYLRKKDFGGARARLEHLLSVDPDSYAAHFNLGVMAAMEENWSGAEKHFQAAVRADPRSREAHDGLGMVLEKEGRTDEAVREMRLAKELTR